MNQEVEDDEEEWGYYYGPVTQTQVPSTERVTEHGDDQEKPEAGGNGPLGEERLMSYTEEPETRDENRPQEEDHQEEDGQVVGEVMDDTLASPRPCLPESNREGTYSLPRRERRAPKVFTYDQLGTPTCYSTVCTNEMPYQYQPIQHRDIQPITMWPNSFQICQPLFMQGYYSCKEQT